MGVNGFQAAAPGFWRSVTGRGSHPTGSVTGCAARHEARHSPRLRLAPACSQPRPQPGVAELGVVRRLSARFKCMPCAIKRKPVIALLIFGLLLSLAAYWWSWSRGFVIASASGGAGSRFIIREIPHSTGIIYMLSDTTDYAYRMESWRWPHFIHDCRTF